MREVKDSQLKSGLRLNMLDKMISVIDPVRGARRAQARFYLGMMSSSGGYHGGSKSRRGLAGWITRLIGGSADADILPDLPLLRERSRDLVRNSPLATGAVSGTTLKVVGRGLRVQAKIDGDYLGLNEDEVRAWQRAAEFEFNTIANSVECDASRRLQFAGIQALAFRSALESGDCFALLPRFSRGPFPYKTRLKLVEADRVCNENNKTDRRLEHGGRMAGGIEYDADGAPQAAYVLQGHPGNIAMYSMKDRKWDKVPFFGTQTGRRNILHLMPWLRPGQSRGVPFLAPVIETLKQLDRYTEAEITAAVVSGMFAVFVKSAGEGISPLDSAVSGKTPGSSGDKKETSWDGSLSGGLVVDLKEGEEVTSVGTNRPNTAFDAFVLSVMRQVGVALDIPYEVLIKHFQASYSASRAALLEAWTFYRARRAWLAMTLCQPYYESIIEEAVLLGRLSAPGFFTDPFVRAAYCRAVWTGDGAGSIDPLKDANAAEKNMKIFRTTLEDEVTVYDGGDYEDKLRQAASEQELKAKLGLLTTEDSPPPDTDSTIQETDREDR